MATHLLLTHRQDDAFAKATMKSASQLDPAFAEYQITVLGFTGDFKSMAALALPAAPQMPDPSGKCQLVAMFALQNTL